MFTTINTGELIRQISKAQETVILATPGIAKSVAEAICDFVTRTSGAVKVALDPDPEVCRLGYGEFEAFKTLETAGIPLYAAKGMRMGICLIDEQGWQYTPTPLVVEEEPGASTFNALSMIPEQLLAIFEEISPSEIDERAKKGESRETPKENDLPEPILEDKDSLREDAKGDSVLANNNKKQKNENNAHEPRPKIAYELIKREEIIKCEKELEEFPPQKFDLSRKVRVYKSRLQFVTINLSNCHVNRRRVSIPNDLFGIEVDDDLKHRISSQYQLLDGNGISVEINKGKDGEKTISLKSIQDEVKDLRDNFTKGLGSVYGRVMLKSKKSAFEKEKEAIEADIEAFKKGAKEAIKKAIQESKKALSDIFRPILSEKPPKQLSSFVDSQKPSIKQVNQFLQNVLDKVFPDLDGVLEDMRFSVVYKDITYEMLTDKEFQEKVQSKFDMIEWDKLFKESDAIEGSASQKDEVQV